MTGKWGIEDVPGASQGNALVQRATNNAFNVIVAPGGPYSDVDVAVRFKPISGGEDASAGIVFRFSEGRYYVVRANALEDNFNLYYYDRGRHQITGARVKAPALGQWYHDSRFTSGRVGLWTKADSITAFDDLVVSPMSGG